MWRRMSICAGCMFTLACLVSAVRMTEEYYAGHALSFDGTGTVAIVSDTGFPAFGSAATIEAWFLTFDIESPQILVSKWADAAPSSREYLIELADGQLRGRIAGSLGTASAAVHAKTVTPGKWTHVALVLDGAAGELRLYVNASRLVTVKTDVRLDADTDEDVLFGAGTVDGQGDLNRFFGGTIDEVRIWSLAMSDADIQARYNRLALIGSAGLEGYWRFDEGMDQQELLDYSGHHRHGWIGLDHESTAGDPARVRSTAPLLKNQSRLAARDSAEARRISVSDRDSDRLWDIWETDDGVYVKKTRTGTNPNNNDTDGDGIRDGDEVLGTTAGLDLPGMGASPLRKDIFVEIDWTSDTTGGTEHSHAPLPEALERIVAAFTNAPTPNPYNLPPGISLHFDYGQGGLFTGGNYLGNDPMVLFDSEFNAYKAVHFAPQRKGIFHYAIFCHAFNSQGNSGVAEQPGDDFLVASSTWYGNVAVTASVCMHELGHNLGLRHGGFEEKTLKPNYNSVMNYRYTFPGVDIDCDAVGDGAVDYSRGQLADLNENSLDENVGICGDVPIDWNQDRRIRRNVARNINCYNNLSAPCGSDNGVCDDAICSIIRDSNDWANVRLPIPPGDMPYGEREFPVCPIGP